MAETLNFGAAVKRAGVSRHRLNQAITSGRLPAIRGGGPGKPTTIQLDDLQAWCLREGLPIPLDTGERLERLSASTGIAEMMARLDQLFTGMQHLEQLMEHVLERLEGPQAPAIETGETVAHVTTSTPQNADLTTERPAPPSKAAILHRLRAMQADGLSLQTIADRFNLEGVPTLSGKGQWRKGTIGKLLAQRDETR
jgi:hypothetical protein